MGLRVALVMTFDPGPQQVKLALVETLAASLGSDVPPALVCDGCRVRAAAAPAHSPCTSTRPR